MAASRMLTRVRLEEAVEELDGTRGVYALEEDIGAQTADRGEQQVDACRVSERQMLGEHAGKQTVLLTIGALHVLVARREILESVRNERFLSTLVIQRQELEENRAGDVRRRWRPPRSQTPQALQGSLTVPLQDGEHQTVPVSEMMLNRPRGGASAVGSSSQRHRHVAAAGENHRCRSDQAVACVPARRLSSCPAHRLGRSWTSTNRRTLSMTNSGASTSTA